MDAAPIGLHTKLRKNGTFQMDVMQKLHIGKLSNLVHNYDIYVWLIAPIMSAKWTTTSITRLFYSGCVNAKFDLGKSLNETNICRMPFKC